MIEERPSEEIEVQEDEILRQRTDKLIRLREEEGYDPFVHEKWIKKHTLDLVKKNFSHLAEDERDDTEIVTAGRLMTLRDTARRPLPTLRRDLQLAALLSGRCHG